MTQRTKDLGVNGENLAAQYLEANGWRILERNFRIRRAEIDLIAEREGMIVFVEVKTRLSNKFGRPAEAVDERKQRKIIMAAGVFMQRAEFAQCTCRSLNSTASGNSIKSKTRLKSTGEVGDCLQKYTARQRWAWTA